MSKRDKCNITDRLLKSLRPEADRYDVMDTAVPGFGVRVSDGRKSFILLTRYPGSNNPTRRTLGTMSCRLRRRATRREHGES